MNVRDLSVTVSIAPWVRPFIYVAAALHLPPRWIENVALKGLRVR